MISDKMIILDYHKISRTLVSDDTIIVGMRERILSIQITPNQCFTLHI